MANGYSLPPWLIPQRAPWEALISGVQAGSQIAANNQRGRALAAQMGHQAFQETVLKQKADADAHDLATLQAWWPMFASAEGEVLANLKVPPIKNGPLWNNLTLEVGKKRQQWAASELANGMAGLDLSTPEGQKTYYSLASKAAKTGLPLTIEQIQAPVIKAQELKRLQATAESTASLKELEAADRFEKEAAEVEESDADLAGKLRQRATLLRAKFTAPTETIETYTDEQGKQQVRVVRGPTTPKKDAATPTTATTSQIQQRMLTADKTLELGSQILGRLTAADVGVAGNINQVVINEGLAQVLPGLSRGSVTEARTLLGQFNEQAIKAIASDPRISDKDRQRYERILPSLGAVESLSSAQDKIRTFMQKFREQSRTDAKAAGLPIPDWTLTADELKAKVAAGEMTYDAALQILMKYHP